MNRPGTRGELLAGGYRYRSVKAELRENLVARLNAGTELFPGLIGYEHSVIPQLINAILAGHDILLLGLRGQAKTRLIRQLPDLLDEWLPVVDGLDVPDDPQAPMLEQTRRRIEELGDHTPIRWLHRSQRYHEKLATPDVTIADLIGEVDLVKHAEGRYLSDEETMHFGLIPHSNRGIFAINELPDLAPRIQVGLFNVLEERDVQIRGYPIRLNLDVALAFTANPEDYTSRGRIVTPLKDRIGAVIRTHYPQSNAEAMRISRENAAIQRPPGGRPVDLSPYLHEIIEETVRLARTSPHVSQQSGVSVRSSIAALEIVTANSERRALTCDEPRIVPRTSDLAHLNTALRGKIELMLAEDEGAEDKLIAALIGEAVKNVSGRYLELESLDPIVDQFVGRKQAIEVGDDVPAEKVLENTVVIRGLHEAAKGVCRQIESPADDAAHLAAAVEFVLEALHVHDKLSKFIYHDRTFYKR